MASEMPLPERHCLSGLSLAQCIQLVRVLGTYGNWRGERMPQKIVDADALNVSWPISSTAAEIIATWPAGFERLLDQLRSRSEPGGAGRMGRAFGGFYAALYRGLKASEFDFVRRAFENYIARAWTGAIGRRNRRIEDAVLNRMEWISGAAGCRLAGISPSKLRRLIDAGQVVSEQRVSARGREFVMVRSVDMKKLAREPGREVTLKVAACALGFKKSRLSALLPVLCPSASRLTPERTPWVIPGAWLDAWLARLKNLPLLPNVDVKTQVTMNTVLRYWQLDDGAVAAIFRKVQCAELMPAGKVASMSGVGSMVFHIEAIRSLRAQSIAARVYVTVPEAAERLEVKQEVAYSLVRSGLLRSVESKVGRRAARLVTAVDLAMFVEWYVFGRDLAQTMGRSPKALVKELAKAGVQPVAGPHIDGCRQILYRATDVQDLMPPTRSAAP